MSNAAEELKAQRFSWTAITALHYALQIRSITTSLTWINKQFHDMNFNTLITKFGLLQARQTEEADKTAMRPLSLLLKTISTSMHTVIGG